MQSKSQAEVEEPVDDSSDEEDIERPPRKFSEDRRDRRREGPYRRPNRFEEREDSRDRTREKQNRNNSRPRNPQNQQYLESMYNRHYNEMMRLYNGEVQPNQRMQNNIQSQPQSQSQQQQGPGIFPSQPGQFGFGTFPTPPPNFSHQNIAQFGSNPNNTQFFGQSCPPPQNYQGFGNWQGPQWQ